MALPRLFKTRVMAYKKGEQYLAVALDFDLLDQGDSMGDVMKRLEQNITSYLSACLSEGESESEIYRPAAKKYQIMYDMFKEWEENKKSEDQMYGVRTFSKNQLVYG